MGERVGSAGYVLATDIDTRWLDTGDLSQVEKRDHNIVSDELPSASFELIHARLVLVWLPEREAVMERLIESLRPGGWLVIENFDGIIPQHIDAVSEDEKTYARVGKAFTEAIRSRGGDNTYSRTLPRLLRAAGLVDVHASGHVEFVGAGTPGADLQRANIDQVGAGMIEAGLVTAEDVATFRRLLDDRNFTGNLPLFITAWGRRPEANS
jgi:SAM-dependent methyltransferase